MVDLVGVAALAAAFIVPAAIEFFKKPKLRIKPVHWQHPGKNVYPMTFASVEVANKPLAWPFRFLNRRAAEACEAFIEYWTWDDQRSRVRVFDTITGRWDSHPQPLRLVPVELPISADPATSPARPGTAATSAGLPGSAARSPLAWVIQTVMVQYDPALDTSENDIAVGSRRGRISPAILRDGEAFAFANESYAHEPSNHLGKPEWKLTMNTTYRVEVHVKGANADHRQAFKLEFYSNDFSKFQLQPVRDKRWWKPWIR